MNKCIAEFVLQVVDIMKTNVEKVLERDQKLSELDDRAGETPARVGRPAQHPSPLLMKLPTNTALA